MTTQTFTGQQFLDVLKDQWCGSAAINVLLPSSTIRYTWDQSIADSIVGQPCAGAPNPVSDVTIGGVALDPAASYRITTNNFLADGGDGFPSLTAGTNRTTLPEGRFDIDSLVDYLEPSIDGRPDRAAGAGPHRPGSRRQNSERCGGGPCAAAARSGTIGGV